MARKTLLTIAATKQPRSIVAGVVVDADPEGGRDPNKIKRRGIKGKDVVNLSGPDIIVLTGPPG